MHEYGPFRFAQRVDVGVTYRYHTAYVVRIATNKWFKKNCRRHAIIHRMPRCLNLYYRARAPVDLPIGDSRGGAAEVPPASRRTVAPLGQAH